MDHSSSRRAAEAAHDRSISFPRRILLSVNTCGMRPWRLGCLKWGVYLAIMNQFTEHGARPTLERGAADADWRISCLEERLEWGRGGDANPRY